MGKFQFAFICLVSLLNIYTFLFILLLFIFFTTVGQINNFPQKVPCQKTDNIVIYCRSGGRAGNAAQTLRGMGYSNCHVFPGGVREWMANQK